MDISNITRNTFNELVKMLHIQEYGIYLEVNKTVYNKGKRFVLILFER